MPNHYHFLLRQDSDIPISTFIQRIFNSYTKAYNKKYERSGTLFEGRFKAIHVDKEGYLLHLCKYIHANPVKALLVEAPEEWEFSNYPEWVGERNGTLIDKDFVDEFGKEYAKELRDHLLHQDNIPEEVKRYLRV